MPIGRGACSGRRANATSLLPSSRPASSLLRRQLWRPRLREAFNEGMSRLPHSAPGPDGVHDDCWVRLRGTSFMQSMYIWLCESGACPRRLNAARAAFIPKALSWPLARVWQGPAESARSLCQMLASRRPRGRLLGRLRGRSADLLGGFAPLGPWAASPSPWAVRGTACTVVIRNDTSDDLLPVRRGMRQGCRTS